MTRFSQCSPVATPIGRNGPRNRRMAEHVVRTRRLFDPQRLNGARSRTRVDGLVDVPSLVGVDHQRAIRPDLLAHERDAARVVRRAIAADLDLEMRPALGERLAAGRRTSSSEYPIQPAEVV